MLRYALCTLTVASFSSAVTAENWPGWRGPNSNGTASAQKVPVEWGPDQNIVWKYEFPGPGASTPTIWNDHIFVTSGGDGKNLAICLNIDGEELWQTQIGEEVAGKHRKATGSNPSATTDGEFVFVYFKSGDFACLDFFGEIVWQQNLRDKYGKDTLWWDMGTSPVLTTQFVLIACMQSGPSYLIAFDKRSGQVAWKHDRNTDAPVEAAHSYSSPIVATHDGLETVVLLGADYVTAHDAQTGEEIWRMGTLNPKGNKFYRSIASPVIDSGIVIAPYARGSTLTAIRMGGSGNVTESHIAWSKQGKNLSSDVPTPAASGGRVYVLADKGNLSCINIETGEIIWQHQLPKDRNSYSASPVLVDGKIYVTREDGMTFVLKDGPQPELLASNNLGEMSVATPVFTQGKVLLRTVKSLYCVRAN